MVERPMSDSIRAFLCLILVGICLRAAYLGHGEISVAALIVCLYIST